MALRYLIENSSGILIGVPLGIPCKMFLSIRSWQLGKEIVWEGEKKQGTPHNPFVLLGMGSENEERPQQAVCYKAGEAKPAAVEGSGRRMSEQKGWRRCV